MGREGMGSEGLGAGARSPVGAPAPLAACPHLRRPRRAQRGSAPSWSQEVHRRGKQKIPRAQT